MASSLGAGRPRPPQPPPIPTAFPEMQAERDSQDGEQAALLTFPRKTEPQRTMYRLEGPKKGVLPAPWTGSQGHPDDPQASQGA